MKYLILLSILIILFVTPAQSRALNKIKKDALTIGMLTTTTPFGKIKNSKLKGIEYEFAAKIAKKLGVRFRIIEISNLRDGKKKLQKDRIDLLISSVKENTGDNISYSIPYYKTGLGIMTLKKNNRIFSAIDLNNKYVAAVAGSTGNTFLKKFIKKAKVELVTSTIETYDLLFNNEVDAIIADKVILDYEATLNPRVKTLDLTLTDEEYVVGVNSKYPKFLKQINTAIRSILTRRNGGSSAMEAILSKYKVPATITIQSSAQHTTTNTTRNHILAKDNMSLDEKVNYLIAEVNRLNREVEYLKKK